RASRPWNVLNTQVPIDHKPPRWHVRPARGTRQTLEFYLPTKLPRGTVRPAPGTRQTLKFYFPIKLPRGTCVPHVELAKHSSSICQQNSPVARASRTWNSLNTQVLIANATRAGRPCHFESEPLLRDGRNCLSCCPQL